MIVVVSGLPRSGTSVVMQMLAAGGLPPFTDGRRAPDDSNPRGYLEHDRVRALGRDSSWVPQAEDHAIKVVAPLLPLLPDGPAYRVVFVERDLDEVLNSQAAMLEASGVAPGRSEALRQAFSRQMAEARAWAAAGAEAVMSVQHRSVVETPRAAAEALARFTAREMDIAAMAAAVEPALYRQRTPQDG